MSHRSRGGAASREARAFPEFYGDGHVAARQNHMVCTKAISYRGRARLEADIANLKAEDIDWPNQTIAYARRKTGSLAMIHFGENIEAVLRRLPETGPLFPYLQSVRAGDRSTEFKQRCDGLGIKGVSLHSYRYAWAERAKQCGYPERFAQLALGHNSKAVHRAYARKAQVKIPALEDFERHHNTGNVTSVSFVKRTPNLPSASESREKSVPSITTRPEVGPVSPPRM